MTVTLITGANKGLGFETARRLLAEGHTVWIGARDPERGRTAADRLGARFVELDVTDDDSVTAALDRITAEGSGLDALVNNAGIGELHVGGEDIDPAGALRAFDTNVVGILRVTQAALPLLRDSEHPVVVNLTSSLGSFWAVTEPSRHESEQNLVVYSATKAAVSMLTVQYAKAEPGIRFTAVEPGYTATDLTGNGAGQRPEEGAEVIAGVVLAHDLPSGTLEERGGRLAW